MRHKNKFSVNKKTARRSEAEIKEKSWVLYVSFRIYYYASEKSVAKASVA